jgi:hypothetical protein
MKIKIVKFKIKYNDKHYDFEAEVGPDGVLRTSNYPILLDDNPLMKAMLETQTKSKRYDENREPEKLLKSAKKVVLMDATNVDGVKVTNVDGRKVIDSVDQRVVNMMPFFNFKEPCFFEGCESLREEYLNEVKKAGGDEKCSSCQFSGLMRKYMKLMQKLPQFKIR